MSGARPRVVVATSNAGKLREFREILADLDVEWVSLAEAGKVDFPEEGYDYEANAVAKARAAADQLGLPALADDSGLEVEGLEGAPGPGSARYGGEGPTPPGAWPTSFRRWRTWPVTRGGRASSASRPWRHRRAFSRWRTAPVRARFVLSRPGGEALATTPCSRSPAGA